MHKYIGRLYRVPSRDPMWPSFMILCDLFYRFHAAERNLKNKFESKDDTKRVIEQGGIHTLCSRDQEQETTRSNTQKHPAKTEKYPRTKDPKFKPKQAITHDQNTKSLIYALFEWENGGRNLFSRQVTL